MTPSRFESTFINAMLDCASSNVSQKRLKNRLRNYFGTLPIALFMSRPFRFAVRANRVAGSAGRRRSRQYLMLRPDEPRLLVAYETVNVGFKFFVCCPAKAKEAKRRKRADSR
jgi:hypothetical protein